MKKFVSFVASLALLINSFGAPTTVLAVTTPTPSTNDINRTNGWAHVDATAGIGEVSLNFIQPRSFFSCFEYRTDGDITQQTSPTNYNTLITDGLYPYKCLSTIGSYTKTLNANQYVEVRMVFGGESDERFDWTRFDVIPPDTTPPAVPSGLKWQSTDRLTNYSCGSSTTVQALIPVWDANTDDPTFSHFEYTSFWPNGSIGLNEKTLNTNEFVNNWVPPNEGTFGFAVRAVDTANNKSAWALSDKTLDGSCKITLDSTAPAVPTLLSPSNGVYIRPVGLILDWSDVSDPSSPVKYYYQSSLSSSVGADNALTSPIYNSGALSSSQINASGSADNTYYWQVKACDSIGNCSTWSNPWQVNIDNTAPAAPVISLPFPEQAFNTTPILNRWSAVSDVSGIDYYRVEYVYDDGHTFSGAPYRTTTSTQRNHVPGISEQGGVTIRVQAVDKAGNAGTWSAPVHYFYDATAPTGTWANPLENDTISGTTTLSFNASDSISGVNSISYQYKKNDGVDTFHDITGTDWDTSGLSLGFYTLRAIVTDNAGNSANFDETVGVAAVILGVHSNTFSTFGATITWITDRPTKSRVVYDTIPHNLPDLSDPNYGYAFSTSTYDTNPEVTNHTVNITGLNDGTIYYFRVISEGSPIAIGGESGFKTYGSTGAPSSGGNGGAVLGASTSTLPTIAWVNSYSSESTSEDVLGAETTATPAPTATIQPTTSGFEPETTTQFNLFVWIMGHKKISLGILAVLILISYFIFRKKKS